MRYHAADQPDAAVTLNGRPVADCVAADTAEGWVAVIDRAAWARVGRHATPPVVRRYGRVRVVGAGGDGTP